MRLDQPRTRCEPLDSSKNRSTFASSALIYDFDAQVERILAAREIERLETENSRLARCAAETTVKVTKLREVLSNK
jgi:hypothetical protein